MAHKHEMNVPWMSKHLVLKQNWSIAIGGATWTIRKKVSSSARILHDPILINFKCPSFSYLYITNSDTYTPINTVGNSVSHIIKSSTLFTGRWMETYSVFPDAFRNMVHNQASFPHVEWDYSEKISRRQNITHFKSGYFDWIRKKWVIYGYQEFLI